MKEALLVVPKSRRMMMTWLMLHLHLWLTMFHVGVNVFVISDKEEKSNDLIKRMEFIFDAIPDEDMLKPKKHSKYCLLEFPGLKSRAMGIAQGAGQLRQYTATAILADEMAYWDRAKETYTASRPTIDGGGKFTGISSAGEGFFYDMCYDRTL